MVSIPAQPVLGSAFSPFGQDGAVARPRRTGSPTNRVTLRELSGAPATHIIYLPRWCHHPPDARVVA